MKTTFVLTIAILAIAGCATAPPDGKEANKPNAAARPSDKLNMFSAGQIGMAPAGWEPMIIFRQKKPTEYQLIAENGNTVLRAFASGASSGLMHHMNLDPTRQPWLQWNWKIHNLSNAVARAQDSMEDAPARIILGFDGDKGTLSFTDQILFETAKVVTGYDFPYATLMYEWHGSAPVETIAKSKRSGRIRTIVVESGTAGVGQWRGFTRNIVEDFQKAYGEMPGRLIGVGVLTDSDASGETVETWYGDIRLLPNVGGTTTTLSLKN